MNVLDSLGTPPSGAPFGGHWQFAASSFLEDLYRLQGFDNLSCNLLTGHLRRYVGLRELQPIGRRPASKQIDHARDYPCPSGLVAGPKARAIIPVEILVVQYVVFPVWILLELFRSPIDWALTTGIAQEDV